LAAGFWFDVGTAALQERHFDAACQQCHAAGNDVVPENAGELVAPQEELCARCHEGAIEASHPSGFTPRRQLPPEFPLDNRGMVTCSTCHDPHGDKPGRLRVAKIGRDLCLSCHRKGFFRNMPDRGESLVASGHLDASTLRSWRIDSYSLRCMDCHSDQASIAGDGRRVAASRLSAGGAPNHPIGMKYDRVASRGGLRPAAALSDEVLLPDGKVSCVSCHDGYGREHGKLVRRGRLCFECHDK